MKPAKRFHFDLSHHKDETRELTFRVGRKRHAVQSHTSETRAAATRDNRALAQIPPEHHHRITHYADVSHEHLPTDRLCLMRVTYDHGNAALPLPALVHATFHIPEKHRAAHRRDKHAKGKPHLPHKLTAYGVDVHALAAQATAPDPDTSKKPRVLRSAAPVLRGTAAGGDDAAGDGGAGDAGSSTAHYVAMVADADQFTTPADAAGFIIFHHPHLASANPHIAARIYDDHINSAENMLALGDLAVAIANAEDIQTSQDKEGWAPVVPDTTPDGTALLYEYQFGSHNPGDPVVHYGLAPEVRAALPAALNTPLKTSSDDPGLKDKSWSVAQGATAVHSRGLAPGQAPLLRAGIGKVKWTLEQPDHSHGLSVDGSSLSFTANPQNDGSGQFAIDVKNGNVTLDIPGTTCRMMVIGVSDGQVSPFPSALPERGGSVRLR